MHLPDDRTAGAQHSSGNVHELVPAYDKLLAHPVIDHNAVVLVGSSYGKHLAALLIAPRPAGVTRADAGRHGDRRGRAGAAFRSAMTLGGARSSLPIPMKRYAPAPASTGMS